MILADPEPLLAGTWAWLAGQGIGVEGVERLRGSTSAAVFRLVAERDGKREALVLRLFTAGSWLAMEPDLAVHEGAVLKAVRGCGVPTPEVVAVDGSGAFCGVPAVVMGCLPGRVYLPPTPNLDWLDRLGEALAIIHTLPVPEFAWRYRSWLDRSSLCVPGWTRYPALWGEALGMAARPEPSERLVFLHRDYHPTNVLWQAGGVSGVVDWVNGCVGPAGVDVSHCRANLAQMYGVAAADAFLAAYVRHLPYPFTYNYYWDVVTLLEVGVPRPCLYPPWREFGLLLTQKMLLHRVDRFLLSVLERGGRDGKWVNG